MCPYKPIEVYMSILLLYWHFIGVTSYPTVVVSSFIV